MTISTTIKKRHDLKTDTVWQICPFCNAEVKDVSYVGHELSRELMGPGGIRDHIAAEHGVVRKTVGKKQRWISLSAEDQAEAKRHFKEWLRTWGKDCIKRVSDYYPPSRSAAEEEQE
jgi:hypothetical protein